MLKMVNCDLLAFPEENINNEKQTYTVKQMTPCDGMQNDGALKQDLYHMCYTYLILTKNALEH